MEIIRGRAVNKLPGVINVAEYGYDRAAIIAAMAAGDIILFTPGIYAVGATYIQVPANKKLIGMGAAIITFTSDSGFPFYINGVDNVEIDGLEIFGGDTVSMKTTLNTPSVGGGIWVNGASRRIRISNCKIHGFGNGAGVVVSQTLGTFHDAPIIENCEIFNNYYGIDIRTRGEHVKTISNTIHNNYIGLKIVAGNTQHANNIIIKNGTGILIATGDNSGHGSITGGSINHNTYPLHVQSETLGFALTGACIYEGIIYLEECTGIVISGGLLAPSEVRIKGGGWNSIHDNFVYDAYGCTVTHNYDGVTDITVLERNYKADASLWS